MGHRDAERERCVCRVCDGTEPEPEARAPEAPLQPPPTAASTRPLHSAPAARQDHFSSAMPGPPPQEVHRYPEYQQPPPTAPMQPHASVAAYAQGEHGAVAPYGMMQPLQFEWPGGGGHPVAPGMQYVHHPAPGQYPQQVVYVQPGGQPGGGDPAYGGQYAQPPQQVVFAGQQYQGQPGMYHYVHQGGPAPAEQPGRMY